MAKLTKAQRFSNAAKAARTKASKKKLAQAVQVKGMLGTGLSTHEIALQLGTPLKVIDDLIKFLSLSSNPYLKAIGIGAGALGTISDIKTNLDAQGIHTTITSRNNASKNLANMSSTGPETAIGTTHLPFMRTLQRIINDPIGVHNDVVNGLNQIGHDVTDPINQLGNIVNGLLKGQ